MLMLRTVVATRYVVPLREGGSLPGVVEADDDGLYVVKFHGAGQGPKALVAETLAGELGRALGLPVPELVVVDLDPALGAAEPDPEVQELLERSPGRNLGMDFLPGALALGAPANAGISPELAADVVWFDALVTNVDRTPRNPNLLLWHRRLYLIDHGAALYAQHSWSGAPGEIERAARSRFPAIGNHVLLPIAGSIAEADARLAPRLDEAAIQAVVDLIPEEWLTDAPPFAAAAEHRAAYARFLTERLAARAWVAEAEAARGRAADG
ncbi:MAG: aminotransferase class I and II [Thermomicrobiales bacterium]|nr:aminotransferase class I and II [Thermomicrobiales bacterium]